MGAILEFIQLLKYVYYKRDGMARMLGLGHRRSRELDKKHDVRLVPVLTSWSCHAYQPRSPRLEKCSTSRPHTRDTPLAVPPRLQLRHERNVA